ncbi:hypothetical protein PACTADRAFT_73288 [Pachysolen tannophilus NRRL Y-2460]|uniref:Ribonucleases P/MRP subunit Pop8-like domain-containing protein n=1 Tax=Pachysolen tannophilus NRRL Y-2460 TaxID=669874 RepID=A0A1E4U0P9_PACTA|nr:hypothetical protein PACTADRAFT_73288 [Pachysolen tannophilus NRRL Y-2460]
MNDGNISGEYFEQKWTLNNIKKDSIWFYFKLQVVVDMTNDDGLDLDLLTWKTILLRSFKKFYGLVGESIQFDLLQKIDNKTVIIRCYKEDKDVVTNSLVSSQTTLDNNVECYIRILNKSQYLVGVTGPSRDFI